MNATAQQRRGFPQSAGVLAVLLFTLPAEAGEVAGWLEPARLEPEGIWVSAKLDTGADRSSLGAADIQIFSEDGRDRVLFRPQSPDLGATLIERPLVGMANIKRHGAPAEIRPVIRLRFCLAGLSKEIDVNLADRSNYEQPLLIGRNFLAGDFLVDPAVTFTTEPRCAPLGTVDQGSPDH